MLQIPQFFTTILTLASTTVTKLPASKVEKITTTANNALSNKDPMLAQKMNESASILGLFWQANIVVQLVMLLLIAASIWSLSIIIEKAMKFREIKQQNKNFERKLHNGVTPANLLQEAKAKLEQLSPSQELLVETFEHWDTKINDANKKHNLSHEQKKVLKEQLEYRWG